MANKIKDINIKFNEVNKLETKVLSKKKAKAHAALVTEYLKSSKYTNTQKREIIYRIIELSKK